MKITIITENFLRIFLFCTAFVGISTFAIEFKAPKTFDTPLKGKLLTLTKKLPLSFSFDTSMVWKEAPKSESLAHEDVVYISSFLNYLILYARDRNKLSGKIKEDKKEWETKKGEFIEKYPNYENLSFEDFGPAAQKSIKQINSLTDSIETLRQDRVKKDKEIVEYAELLDELFIKAGYTADYLYVFFKDF